VNKEERLYWGRFWKRQTTIEQQEQKEIDMAMTPEGKVKEVVKKFLKEKGIYYIMPATGGYGSSGAPDIVVCHKGKFYGLEVKSGENKPTALQMDNLNRIEKNGGYAIVINESNVNQYMEVHFS
jgi:predicted AAA+ superfamily ATPase